MNLGITNGEWAILAVLTVASYKVYSTVRGLKDQLKQELTHDAEIVAENIGHETYEAANGVAHIVSQSASSFWDGITG